MNLHHGSSPLSHEEVSKILSKLNEDFLNYCVVTTVGCVHVSHSSAERIGIGILTVLENITIDLPLLFLFRAL